MLTTRSLRVAGAILAAVLLLLACGETEQDEANQAPELKIGAGSAEVAGGLVGHWKVQRGNDLPPGEMEFFGDGSYRLKEYINPGTQVTREGEYRLDALAKPYAIDLCLGDCDITTAQFVTELGIVQFPSKDSVVIELSSSDQRPAAFPAKPGENTLVLTRLN